MENYYGEAYARISEDQSVYPEPKGQGRHWVLRIFSALLFWMPEQCMVKFEKMWVDDTLCESRWMEFLSERRKEWEKTITPVGSYAARLPLDSFFRQATVLLSANVGLLAISSVDEQHGTYSRNLAQVASYASVLMSLGSYVTGHILSLQHTKENRGSVVRQNCGHNAALMLTIIGLGHRHRVSATRQSLQSRPVSYCLQVNSLPSGLSEFASHCSFSLPSALFMWRSVILSVTTSSVGIHISVL